MGKIILLAIMLFMQQVVYGEVIIERWDNTSLSWVPTNSLNVAGPTWKFKKVAKDCYTNPVGHWVANLFSPQEGLIATKTGTGAPIEGIFFHIPPGHYTLEITCACVRRCETNTALKVVSLWQL